MVMSLTLLEYIRDEEECISESKEDGGTKNDSEN